MSVPHRYLFALIVVCVPFLIVNLLLAQGSEPKNNLSLQLDSPIPLQTYVEVTGPGIKTPLQYKLNAGRGKAGATLYVPLGNNRTFKIFVQNDKANSTYFGTTTIAVKQNTPSTLVQFTPYHRPDKLTGLLGTYRVDIEQQPSPARIGQPVTYNVQVLDARGKPMNMRKSDVIWSGGSAPSFPKPKKKDDDDPILVPVLIGPHVPIQTCWQSGACSFPWFPVLQPQPFKRIVSGDNFSCALDASGAVWCWGDDWQLQLGYPTDYVSKWPNITGTLCNGLPCSTTPVQVSGGITFQSITAGSEFVCGIDTSGKGWCWGDDSFGQFGDTSLPVPPQAIGGAFSDSHKFLSLSAGSMHACGVTTDHQLFCWGRNQEGQLGIGSTNPVAEPTAVNVAGKQWSAVSAGTFHTCGLTTDSQIYCWGDDASDELGIDVTQTKTEQCTVGQNTLFCMRSPTTPVPAGLNGGSGRWDIVSAGHNFSCGRDAANLNVYCWGERDSGQLGDNNPNPSSDMSATPLQVNASSRLAVLALPKADWYACALPFNVNGPGDAVCWGAPFFNGVPWPNTGSNILWSPAPVPGLVILDIAPASDHICALDNNDRAWCWGSGGWGQLGNGNTADSATPVAVLP